MTRSATVQFKIRGHGEYMLTPDGLTFLRPLAESPLAADPVDQEFADMVFEDIDGHHVTPEEAVPTLIAREFMVPEEWVFDTIVTPLPALPEVPENAIS
jgi:hypothetical protein